jgi:hypothetical protein
MRKISDLKKEAQKWAYKYLDKIAVYNRYFNNFIEVNKNGIDHTLNSKTITEAHILAFYDIKDILFKARYMGNEEPRHNQLNIIKIHIFSTNKIIKGIKYQVRIIVREVSVNSKEKNRHFFYDHSIIEKV